MRIRATALRLLVLACLASSVVLPHTAASATESGVWTPEVVVGSDEIDPASFSMSLSQGAGVATWLAKYGDHWEVRASLRTSAGSWGSAQTLSTPGLPTESPYVAAITTYRPPPRNNVAVVAWRAYDGVHWRIQASVLRPGRQWSKPVTLSPPDGDAGKPVAHVVQWGNGEREPRVLWTYRGSAGGVSRLQFVRLDLDGLMKNPPKTVSASGREVRDLVIGDDFTAMWTEFDGSHWRLRTGDIAFLQQPGSRSTVTPAGEDVSQPTKAIGDSTSGYAWIASDGSTPRVRALLSMCDPVLPGRSAGGSSSGLRLTGRLRGPGTLRPSGRDAGGRATGGVLRVLLAPVRRHALACGHAHQTQRGAVERGHLPVCSGRRRQRAGQ